MHRIRRVARLVPALLLATALLWTPAGLARAGAPQPAASAASKVDPALRFLWSRWNESRALGPGAARVEAEQSLLDPGGFFHLRREADMNEPAASMFVRLSDPSAVSVLEAEGARVRTRIGDIAVASVPVSRVMALAEREEIRCMEIAGTSTAFLDSSRSRSHVNEVYAGTGLDRAYRGSGVVVGVLDSGIDYTHPDFKTAGGSTRIKAMYDFSNLREWSVGSIDSGTCLEYDGHGSGGHGTHVSGTAAGGGQRNAAYRGIAPLADIMFVKGTRDTSSTTGFDDGDVVDGVNYLFTRARELDEPCVVNLSLGEHFGAHDGTSLFEQSLDGLSHPGNIVVVSAGNSGQSYIHGGFTASAGSSFDDAYQTPWVIFSGVTQSVVDIWYPGSDNIRFGVAVYSGGDLTTALANTNAVPPGSFLNNSTLTDGSVNYGKVTIDATTTSDPNNGEHRVLILVGNAPASAPASNYLWMVYAFGSGTFDMWTVTGGGFPPASYFGGSLPFYMIPGDNQKSISIPATAKRVISVGSYVTRTQWFDVNNQLETQGGATLGQISTFSSIGPSGDGRALPNLAAPGEAIIAPLAAAAAGTTLSGNIAQGGGYVKLQGTSMAAPHVTGTIALMLERNRYLTPENARVILQSTATVPTSPDPNLWGAGKLNALAAMLATPASITCGTPAPNGATSAASEDCPQNSSIQLGALQVRPNPLANAATLAYRLGTTERVELAVYDLAGRRVRVLQSGPVQAGPHELVWDATDDHGARVTSGIYFTRLRTPSRAVVQRLVVVQ